MQSKIKLLVIILSLLALSSCGPYWYKPYGKIFTHMPKGGSPGFELGWKHGCESGLGSQFGGAIYMTFYSWKKDPDISSVNPDIAKIHNRYRKELRKINWNNPNDIKKNFGDYNSIFWSAHAYCRHAVLNNLQMAGMTPTLPGDERYAPGSHNLGSVYEMDKKGDTRWSYW